MKDIPDGSIDMILCDLPYGTTACKWDTIIPFEPLWEQYNRIIKDNGAIVLFGSEPFSSHLRMSNIKNYRYDWIWKKNKATQYLNANRMPLNDYEIISVFYKKLPNYNPQMGTGKKYSNKHKPEDSGECYGKVSYSERKDVTTRFPRRIIEFGVDMKAEYHPTQKPVALLEYLVKTYTNQGYVVLDNCMGSGSTGIACVNTGRRFIGMELDENYFNIAKERIEKVKEIFAYTE
jgi:site-specific DNA-methyltransferase (adenine-specific)